MKLIQPSAAMIAQTHPIKKIEIVGRTCYKSEDKIIDDSALKFVNGLISKQHFAMLEHARITFEVTGFGNIPASIINMPAVGYTNKVKDGEPIHYVTLSLSHIFKHPYTEELPDNLHDLFMRMFYISFLTKYTTATTEVNQNPGECSVQMSREADVSEIHVRVLDNIREQIVDFDLADHDIHDYYSIRFVCDRGVSHELVRHRAAVAQESTRYCNYAKDKHDNEIKYVYPAGFDKWDDEACAKFVHLLLQAEEVYMSMINDHGMSPQQARAALPNALKTEVILTMPVWQWKHFFNLRSIGTTGAPHPDMKVVADMALTTFNQAEELAGYMPYGAVDEPSDKVDNG